MLHHTECAMRRFAESELAQRIAAATNHPFHDELGVFTDDVSAVAEDVVRVRAYPSLAHPDRVRGFLYDLATNVLTEVAPLEARLR